MIVQRENTQIYSIFYAAKRTNFWCKDRFELWAIWPFRNVCTNSIPAKVFAADQTEPSLVTASFISISYLLRYRLYKLISISKRDLLNIYVISFFYAFDKLISAIRDGAYYDIVRVEGS